MSSRSEILHRTGSWFSLNEEKDNNTHESRTVREFSLIAVQLTFHETCILKSAFEGISSGADIGLHKTNTQSGLGDKIA